MTGFSPTLFIYVALPCEAKPVIEHYRLKKITAINAFAVYGNHNLCLTVTGIGKAAMAAGIAYTQAWYAPAQNPALLNIGIAGHRHHPVGSCYLIEKISDRDTGRCYYPPLIFTPPCPTQPLQTFSIPQADYPEENLCDMEASAFYETASRFSSGELIQCLKIVSDNLSSPTSAIEAKGVSSLIEAQLPAVSDVIKALTQLSSIVSPLPSDEFQALLKKFHFTVNQQIQLRKLLNRRRLIKDRNGIEIAANTSQEFLRLLTQSLDDEPFML